MIAALLLAGVCAATPLFDDTGGPLCSDARQSVECGCTECFRWDDSAGATSYEVQREHVASSVAFLVGIVPEKRFVDPETGDVEVFLSSRWCVARDFPFPVEGELYAYTVRACNVHGCSSWASPPVLYRAAPYACFAADGLEEPCYAGDPLIPRP